MAAHLEIEISAIALLSALGCTPEELADNLLAGKIGPSFQHRYQDIAHSPLGEIPWPSLGIEAGDSIASDALMVAGCTRVLDDLHQRSAVFTRFKPEEISLFIGTTTAGTQGFFSAMQRSPREPMPPFRDRGMQLSTLIEQLEGRFPIAGPSYTFSASCTASAHAFGLAYDAVRSSACLAAIVIGADILNPVTIAGFDALQLLDPAICRPFHPDRKGINLAEAMVGLLLEKASTEGPRTLVKSYSCLSEAFHMTRPAPEGQWMQTTMEQALLKAGISATDLSYINPHGTGTEANDACEAQAVQRLFGNSVSLYPTKGLTGHTLGASGALEIAITELMLGRLDILKSSAKESQADSRTSRFGLSNSFGFGGSNVSVILERLP